MFYYCRMNPETNRPEECNEDIVGIFLEDEKVTLLKRIFRAIVRSQDVNFWVLISFLPAFVISRLLVWYEPGLFLLVRGVHIHHLTYGIFILALAGGAILNLPSNKSRVPWAILYGVGLGLAFDEFGMWIHLADNYWIRQSYDAIIIISVWPI